LRIQLRPSSSAGEVFLKIPARYFDSASVTEVQPPPAAVELQGENLVYSFRVARGTHEMHIHFRLKMEKAGRLYGSVAAGEVSLPFTQFVFP
jgi:hypothetical protein